MLPLLALSIGLVSSTSHLSAPPRLETLADAQNGQVVRVPSFLSPREICKLREAAESQDAPRQDIHKRQGAPEGSWFTVFLNHRLRLLLPAVHDRMFEAAREADVDAWQLLDSKRHDIAMRCVEFHSVTTGGGIPMKQHHDYGSLLTLDIMLSEPGSDFEGGDFCTVAPDGSTLKPQQFEAGDLLIFNSHQYHCVQPVTSGRRQVLVSEIWEGLERRCVRRCNVPWGPCECQFQPPPKKYVNADQLTKVKPTLRLMAKTDGELGNLATNADAEERQLVRSHMLWKRLQALDKLKNGAS